MAGKERPVLVAIITAMGVIIAALITSGYLRRNSAAEREDTLERRIQYLEAELKRRDESTSAEAKKPTEVPGKPLGGSEDQTPGDQQQPVNLGELANKLAEAKKIDILASGRSARGAIAENAMKEYVFVGSGNAPLLFTLEQPSKHFWAEVDILDSQEVTLVRGEGFYNLKNEISFTPPKNGAYIIKLRGTRGFGDYLIEMTPLIEGTSK